MLGDPALENLIRSLVRDNEWSPGQIHRRMLSLPWTDVLTTNWDTLLERTVSSNPDLSYDIVQIPTDIARTRPPRIVKLHGSLPSHGPFILTATDYRTYPDNFAPFVNLARQVLLENELCLIGFSGDDPNFLEWSGWVRDQLGESARPIRLVGDLKLSHSRRCLLKERNITPIDLGPLVASYPEEDRHHRAIEIFLKYLEGAKPSKAVWNLTPIDNRIKDLPDPSSRMSQLSEIWAKERESHPGWLVTPSYLRAMISDTFRACNELLRSNLNNASKSVRASILYEAVWRSEIAFSPLPDFLENAASGLVSSNKDDSLNLKQRVHLRTAIVRSARHRRDWVLFEDRINFLERMNDPSASLEAVYERCLKARDELDYKYIVTNASRITGHDPIWLLRRAALCAEVGDGLAAVNLIQEAHREIRKRRAQNRQSLWLLSREAWAAWLARNARLEMKIYILEEQPEWPLDYKAADTDPWDELRQLDSKITQLELSRLDSSQDLIPQFDAGVYSAPPIRIPGFKTNFLYNEVNRLAEHVGVPLRLNMTLLLGSQFVEAVKVSEDYGVPGVWAALRAVAAYNGDLIDNRFNRIAIARLPLEIASEIAERVRSAVEFGQDRQTTIGGDGSRRHNPHWSRRIYNLIEILSRLSVRFRGDNALGLFRLGTSLAKDPDLRHGSIERNLESLIERSLKALEPERRCEVALDVLCLPLVSEMATIGKGCDWHRALDILGQDEWRISKRNHEWSSRINYLIHVVIDGSNPLSRQDATYRLLKLLEADILTQEEKETFGSAIWQHTGDDGFPKDTNLLPHIFLMLPSPDSSLPKQVFYSEVVQKLTQGLFSEFRLEGLIGASYSQKGEHKPYVLNPKDASAILSHALKWQRRSKSLESLLNRHHLQDDRVASHIGRVLAATVLPSLSRSKIGETNVRAFFDRIGDGSFPELLMALPTLVKLDNSLARTSTQAIQKGLISQHLHIFLSALNAVSSWQNIARQNNTTVPRELIDETVSICLLRREPCLDWALHCLRLFIEAGVVSESDRTRLVDAFSLLLNETNYENWIDEAHRSDVSLIRKQGVRLAAALKNAGMSHPVLDQWVLDTQSDPMPEVRYALSV